MSPTIRATVDESAFRRAEADLIRLPFELRTNVIVKVTRHCGQIYQRALSKELEDNLSSLLTDSRAKQSAKVKASRPEHHLYETVITKGVSYGENEVAVAGPAWPSGNLVNFYVSSHSHPSWGHDPMIQVGPRALDIAARVADEVTPQLQSEFERMMRELSDKELAKLGR